MCLFVSFTCSNLCFNATIVIYFTDTPAVLLITFVPENDYSVLSPIICAFNYSQAKKKRIGRDRQGGGVGNETGARRGKIAPRGETTVRRSLSGSLIILECARTSKIYRGRMVRRREWKRSKRQIEKRASETANVATANRNYSWRLMASRFITDIYGWSSEIHVTFSRICRPTLRSQRLCRITTLFALYLPLYLFSNELTRITSTVIAKEKVSFLPKVCSQQNNVTCSTNRTLLRSRWNISGIKGPIINPMCCPCRPSSRIYIERRCSFSNPALFVPILLSTDDPIVCCPCRLGETRTILRESERLLRRRRGYQQRARTAGGRFFHPLIALDVGGVFESATGIRLASGQ